MVSVVERGTLLILWYCQHVRGSGCRHWSNCFTMQSGVLQAKTAAAQAEQRVTDAEARALGERTEGVVDTRLLGKPKSFDGPMDNWRHVKFTFLGYAGAVNGRLKQAMIESEVLQEAAIMHSRRKIEKEKRRHGETEKREKETRRIGESENRRKGEKAKRRKGEKERKRKREKERKRERTKEKNKKKRKKGKRKKRKKKKKNHKKRRKKKKKEKKKAGAVFDRLQCCQGNSVETRFWKDQARGTDIFVAAGGNPKSERVKMRRVPGEQNLADHLTKEKPWHEIDALSRGVGGSIKNEPGHQGE